MISAYRIVRYLMIIFNVIFLLCGIGVLVAGIIARVDREDRLLYLEVCDKFGYHSVSYITIASGLFIIIVSAIGFIGTLRESRSVLLSHQLIFVFAGATSSFAAVKQFTFCLFTLFLLEATIGILAAVYQTEIEDELKDCMNGTLRKYYLNEKLKSSWDKLQDELSCCGVLSSKDYEYASNRPFNMTVPEGCIAKNLKKGCHTTLKEKASDELAILAIIAGFIIFVELLGIGFALWIIYKISEKYHT